MPQNVLIRLVILKPGFSFTVDEASGPAAILYDAAKGAWWPAKDGSQVTGTMAMEQYLLSYDNDKPPTFDLAEAASIALLAGPKPGGEDPWPVPPPPPPPPNASLDKLADWLRGRALDGSWTFINVPPGKLHILP